MCEIERCGDEATVEISWMLGNRREKMKVCERCAERIRSFFERNFSKARVGYREKPIKNQKQTRERVVFS